MVLPFRPFLPVTCNYGSVMPSRFDILEIPVTALSALAEQLELGSYSYPVQDDVDIINLC
ncbi:hypothetical protein glysoja_045823 [Glycine soja]|uniref:Uncharacterized protein n=1 Tax=Glycine soja TaxID=3848 RepID=A0A0B2R3Q5_GLYSO|nr:hypothetical protein glysoja_045823 [Glycine soja]